MSYKLKIDGKTWEVQADKLDDGQFEVVIDGKTRKLTAIATAPNSYQVTLEDGAQKLVMVQSPEGLWVWSNGKARLVVDASTEAPRRGSGDNEDLPTEVTPTTPATVISVAVKAGDAVTKGQALVLVSAMKMETTLTAPYDGTVTAVNTEAGAVVSPGDILVELEPAVGDEEAEEK
jgi:biotin carboxyl carrier protein